MPGLLARLDHLSIDAARYDLEAGITPAEIVRSRGYEPIDLIAVAASIGLDEEGPPLTQARGRHPKLLEAMNLEALGDLFPDAARPKLLALAAGLYQALDAWDASHSSAQEADDRGERAVSAYWHGIAHRREPDAWNAGYWFRRVGRHAIHPELAAEARRLGLGRLARGDAWDGSAFIAFCTNAQPGTPDESLARRVQRAEMDLLLEASVADLG